MIASTEEEARREEARDDAARFVAVMFFGAVALLLLGMWAVVEMVVG